MEYVEFLRIRRSLAWHIGIIVVLGFVVMLVGGNEASVNINGSTRVMSGMQVPLGIIASIAAFYGAIFASSAGTSLNRENETREISWTKPIPRSVLALRYIAIDLAGVAIAYVAAIVVIMLVLLRLHITPFFDGDAPVQLALGLGVGVMWYALIAVITCTLPPGARSVSGVIWAAAFGIGALTQVPGAIGTVAGVLDILNPLSYMGKSSAAHGPFVAAQAAPAEIRTLIVWCFTAVFCAIAVTIWPRAEA